MRLLRLGGAVFCSAGTAGVVAASIPPQDTVLLALGLLLVAFGLVLWLGSEGQV